MADDIDLPLGDPPIEDPAPDPLLDAVTEPVVEELPPEPPPPAPEPDELIRIRQERDQLRQWASQLEARVFQGQHAPQAPQPPEFFTHMTAEQKTAWLQSVKELEPVLSYREQRMQAAIDQRLRAAEQRSEVAELRGEYGDDFRQHEAQLVQVRAQIAQQGGQWLPLSDLYLHLKGQQAVQAERTSRNTATQRARKPAASAARPVAVAPAGVRTPAGGAAALSDEELWKAVNKKAGLPTYEIPKKQRAS